MGEPDRPAEPNPADPDRADADTPLSGLRRQAGGSLAKAAGVDGADILLSRQGTSDGSLGGDTRELIEHTAAGARLGAKVGAAPGAAVGAAAGTAVSAVKNKRTRRRLVLVLSAPTVAGVLAWTMVIVALGSMVADHDQNRDGMSTQAALSDGLTGEQIGVYRAAAESSGVPWVLLAAVDRAAGHWSGPGDPPYGLADRAAVDDDLVGHGIDRLPVAQFADRVAAGYAYGRLFTARLGEVDRDLDPEDIDAGAGVVSDPGDADRQIIAVDGDDPHATATHDQVRSAFVTALAGMPSVTAGDAATIFDTAYRWAIGQAQDCGSDPYASIGGDPSVPRPTGRGARIDVSVATWNTLFTNPAARVVAGIEAIGASADVIGLQELSSSQKRRAVAAGLGPEWAMYAGGDGNNTTPIVWKRSAFDLIAYGAVQASGLVRIEPGGSGTALGPRWISWVQLRQKSTGGSFAFVNTHFIPTIDAGGRPDASRPERLGVYDAEMTALLRVIDRLKVAVPVIGTMDANIDARGDARNRDPRWPYVRLGQHGVSTSWRVLGAPASGGTHDTRLIDYVWSTSATIIPTGQQIGDSYGSDHRSLRVSLSSAPTGLASAGGDEAAIGVGSLPDRLTVPGGQPGSTLTLTGEQVSNASTVIAEGKAADVPMFGWVVALAAALQESGVRNLGYGDRDSQGMFQQRPSSGWGTPAQIRDPHLASRAFYGVADHTANPGLTDIAGWQSMSVAAAAQAVQRSAFPDAYAKWEPAARAIVQRLAGIADPSAAGIGPACAQPGGSAAELGGCPATGLPVENGLTPDALLVLRCVHQQFPQLSTFYGIGNRPANTDDDHQTGRAVDLMIPGWATPSGSALGWQVASWVREHQSELGVHYVIYAAKIWNVDRDAEGWRTYRSITGSDNPTSLHFDHVHVSVFGDRATGVSGGAANLPAGAWTMPLPTGSYRVGCGFGCYAGHTGQDFPAPAGTPLRSSDDGIVIRSEALRDGAGNYRSYGNLIVVAVAGSPGTTVWYGHLSRRDVTVGQHVRAGQRIGATGFTGHVIPAGPGGAHLHYEIRVGGSPINPLPYLRQRGVTP